ncbi:MAG: diguanylate cyclase [Pseudomonadota bacterium]
MNYILERRLKTLGWLTLGLALAGALAFVMIRDTAGYFVERQAVAVAEMVVTLSKTARSVYSQEVVKKLQKDGTGSNVDFEHMPGYIPIPAQFLKLLGQASTKNTSHLFQYRPVSKWNLEPTQGLTDDFLRWAWPQLESQDQAQPDKPIDWKPVWRIETQADGTKALRYLAADPASSQLCVDCHNSYERTEAVVARRQADQIPTGKEWQMNQLMGALSVTVPLERIETMAAEQIRRAVLWIVGILLSSLVAIGVAWSWSAAQRRKVAHLSWQATHDALTELTNRRGFERSLNRFWVSATEEDKPHTLAMIDLDNFKPINDTYGHHAGDEVLKLVAKTIKSHVRASDVVARLGGDEFAVLFHGCPTDRALGIAETICQAIQDAKLDWDGHKLGVGASIGLAVITGKTESVRDVVETADAACYTAKKAGKNRVFGG